MYALIILKGIYLTWVFNFKTSFLFLRVTWINDKDMTRSQNSNIFREKDTLIQGEGNFIQYHFIAHQNI